MKKLAINRARIRVDLRFNRIIVGMYKWETIQPDVTQTYRFNKRTKSIELLSRLAKGDWVDEEESLSFRTQIRWVETILVMINLTHGTDFRLEQRALYNHMQTQVGLVGG